MKFMVVGSDGRAHVSVSKLAQSLSVTDLWCAPGNPGIAEEVLKNGKKVSCVPILATEILRLRDFAKQHKIHLTIVGPEKPLTLGITDLFEAEGLTIFGPNKSASRLEGSKCFAQEFAERHGLPFASGKCFDDSKKAKAFAKSFDGRCVVKADGLCEGKGAFVCHSYEQAVKAIDDLLVRKTLAVAGERIVIQELLEGYELSIHILCDGETWKVLPSAQDYKMFNGNQTGGMGAYCPHQKITPEHVEQIATSIMAPFLKGCRAEGIVFQGLLYPGIMMTKYGPKILEFNVRFGDPETQAIMPILKTDLAELLLATVEGRLAEAPIVIHENLTAVCVVLASPGYPDNPIIGKRIFGLEDLKNIPGVKIFHAGTWLDEPESPSGNSRLVTNGGRILCVSAWDRNLNMARCSAYNTACRIIIEGGSHMRFDIGEIYE